MLRDRIDAAAESSTRARRVLAGAVRAVGHVRRFIVDPRARSEQLTRILRGGSQFQGATYTEPDRYPVLFAACRDHLAPIPAPAILSFGCSTGEEAATISRYIPSAIIVGVDINGWCLRQCSQANTNPRIHYFHAASPEFIELSESATFDAVFAMAVFQRSENRTNTGTRAHRTFTFQTFEQEIATLDRMLRPGGLFFIDHTDFRFQDAATAAAYSPLECAGNRIVHNRPIFGPDNRLMAMRHYFPRAFVKHGEPMAVTDARLLAEARSLSAAFRLHTGPPSPLYGGSGSYGDQPPAMPPSC